MNVEDLKARLRALLHQSDMLAYEHASLELFDLMEEVEEEIQELTRKLFQLTSGHRVEILKLHHIVKQDALSPKIIRYRGQPEFMIQSREALYSEAPAY